MIITEIFVVAITLQISFSLSGKFEKSCWSLIHCIAAQNFVPVLAPLPFIVHRPVTSLGYQVGRSVFWGAQVFQTMSNTFSRWGEKFCRGVYGPDSAYESYRHLQPSRSGCHYCKVQDQAFAFCGQFGTVRIFWTGPSTCTSSVFCCVP